MFKTVESERWRWSWRLFFFFFLSQFELRDWTERFQKCYIDTGVFSPTNIFNLLIKQEGVLSQQAVEIKAKEKWLYLT